MRRRDHQRLVVHLALDLLEVLLAVGVVGRMRGRPRAAGRSRHRPTSCGWAPAGSWNDSRDTSGRRPRCRAPTASRCRNPAGRSSGRTPSGSQVWILMSTPTVRAAACSTSRELGVLADGVGIHQQLELLAVLVAEAVGARLPARLVEQASSTSRDRCLRQHVERCRLEVERLGMDQRARRLGLAEEDRLVDLLAVDQVGQRLAHALVRQTFSRLLLRPQ